ncbi:MAG: phosphotransferase [Prevotellaceae bacterium]|nr:phosphotransferase [Prevotellaceae bacterium]
MEEKSIIVKGEGTFFNVSGKLDGQGAEELVSMMNPADIYTFDFSDVTDINFAAMRTLLRCRQGGQQFAIINANDNVVERMEDTGVATFVSICRKPKPLDMSMYKEFGGSFLSKSFNSNDGDSMMKLYGPYVPERMVAQEKVIARAVMQFGIPTPLVGTIYRDGENMALDFERIEGKVSFSRMIANNPERLEEVTIRFAKMCKDLHTKPCDTAIFPNRKTTYRQAIVNCPYLNDEEKDKALAFIDAVPNVTTCLHGDCQLSNVITNGKEDLWIDLADFSYGSPMFDMGMWYFLSKLNSEERAFKVFNFGTEMLAKVWDVFVREYFGADTPEKAAEIEAEVQKFAAIHMIYLVTTFFPEGNMVEYIKEKLTK